jgi:hypothetical protein
MSKTIVVDTETWEMLWKLKRKWKKRSLNAVIKDLLELLVSVGETI